ncbi:MAG: right-handed parallel beta-helix repeat-containing protein [Candidatus Latescibacterota bacterium]|nr:MAG: right-handed parallel beta-helix repeat-containing protein [Candidatus Latescibacterota bacterium]
MSRLLLGLFLALATLSIAPHDTSGATWLVKPDGSGDAPTIQAAVDSTSDGDVILLSNGIFTGHGNRDIQISTKAIMIRSASMNPESCVVDCERTDGSPHYGFELLNYHPLGIVIEGLTITHCYSSGHGGAIKWPGGASSLTVNNCIFSADTAYSGGAIDVGMSGAGKLTLNDCEFADNWSIQEGGAVHLSELGEVRITGCRFVRNKGVSGGGICIWETTNVVISYCWFESNQTTGSGGYGGGIAFKVDSAGLVRYCVFVRNWATRGGGVECHDSSPTIESCTFYANRAPGGGGGVRSFAYFGEADVTISKTVIAFGTGGYAVGCAGTGIATLYVCDLYQNAGGDWVFCISDQLGIYGNMCANPRFCDTATGDFRLHENSPCLPENNESGELIGALGLGCPDPTGVGEDRQVPDAPGLRRVYPNPFNPVTKIEYSVPITGLVRLAVYDVKGREIRLLADEVQPMGNYSVLWEGCDNNGVRVSSGVYFVRMEHGGDTWTHRMVFLK